MVVICDDRRLWRLLGGKPVSSWSLSTKEKLGRICFSRLGVVASVSKGGRGQSSGCGQLWRLGLSKESLAVSMAGEDGGDNADWFVEDMNELVVFAHVHRFSVNVNNSIVPPACPSGGLWISGDEDDEDDGDDNDDSTKCKSTAKHVWSSPDLSIISHPVSC